ncbi:retron St85 family RNA-directed DNA polymerase [Gluconobacter frateurii]|uniref:retron St85 family RNA-directed DNA polymerase n=1 Tax=Gluconobacter frateurii TaxID=38308 RepID=UPI001F05EBBD|nr:retron St85 family RNA-directed DNA polymerase [Gluconobacter frateurii]UMM09624.1 retron St85 family RNA-directed DNA polymerase [Gluconobacter frateurii]
MMKEHLVTEGEPAVRFPDVLQILSEETGLLISDIRHIISSAEVSYKTYTIPKRSGGMRVISQPSRQVKILQQAIINRILLNLPIHESATAYRKGKSILDNAHPHQGAGRTILKIDFSQFFPSIKSADWVHFCKKNKLMNDIDQYYTSKILFKKEPNMRGLRLAIGAPSSPLISNILMYDFDNAVNELIVSEEVVYTRYADDLTFSAPRTGYLVDVESKLRKIIRKNVHPRLKINEEKTVYATSKYRRSVTGIILTNNGNTSIGRQKKRIISSCVHHAKCGLLSAEDLKKLSGYLAYISSVEPDFLQYLRKKYGDEIIELLKKIGNPNTKVELIPKISV